jgi:hypothetical protein
MLLYWYRLRDYEGSRRLFSLYLSLLIYRVSQDVWMVYCTMRKRNFTQRNSAVSETMHRHCYFERAKREIIVNQKRSKTTEKFNKKNLTGPSELTSSDQYTARVRERRIVWKFRKVLRIRRVKNKNKSLRLCERGGRREYHYGSLTNNERCLCSENRVITCLSRPVVINS